MFLNAVMRVLLINAGLVYPFVRAAVVPAWAGAIGMSPSDVYAQAHILLTDLPAFDRHGGAQP